MSKFSLPVVGKTDAPAEAASTDASQYKTRAQGGDVNSEIQHEINTHKVVLYMKGSPDMPQCGFSARASQILGSFGIPYHTINILADPEIRQGIKTFSEWPTIPQVYIGGEFVGGSDLLMEMYQNGELKEALDAVFA